MHFAELPLNLADLIARVLEFVGHFGLRVGSHLAGNLGGVFDGVLQGGSDAIEALRDALGDGFQLSGAPGLRRGNGLEVAAQFTHLGFDGAALLAPLQALQSQPEHQDSYKNHAANQECVHSLSNSFMRNGLPTLAEVEGRKLKVEREERGAANAENRGTRGLEKKEGPVEGPS